MFGNGGSSTDVGEFEIFRELESGDPVGVASVAAEFSPYKKDPSAKVYVMDVNSNYPMKIETAAVNMAAVPAVASSPSSDIVVQFRHNYPDSYSEMLDLSPSQFALLTQAIKENEVTAMKYLQ